MRKPKNEIPTRDRVVELRRVKGSELRANPKNWRTHPTEQRSALRGLLEEVGIADALIAYESPSAGGALTLIDGHLRQDETPETEWPVLVLDLTDEEADMVLATLDPLAGMATTALDQLANLLEQIEAKRPNVEALLAGIAADAGIKPPDFEPVNAEDLPRLDEKKLVACPEAGNWFFLGASAQSYLRVLGEIVHPRTIYDRYGPGGQSLKWLQKNVDPTAERVPMEAKLKYALPLDRRFRRKLAEMSKPYPKRLGSIDSDARAAQARDDGASPISRLHSSMMIDG